MQTCLPRLNSPRPFASSARPGSSFRLTIVRALVLSLLVVLARHVAVYSQTTNGPVCTDFVNYTTDNSVIYSNVILDVFALDQRVYAATENGLSISTDGGRSFTISRIFSDGLVSSNVFSVYAVGNTVYATTNKGLSISTNGGGANSFTNRTTNNGLGSDAVLGVYAVGSTVYAATENGLSISMNGGQRFANYTTADSLGDNRVLGVYAVNNTVYAATAGGLSISTNGGQRFTNYTTTNGLGDNLVYQVYYNGPDHTIYAATQGGLSISTDEGKTFTNYTTANGLGSNNVLGVYVVGKTVYAGTDGGLSISYDGGQSFTNYTTANGLGSNYVFKVYALGNRIFTATNHGVGVSRCPLTGLSASPNPVQAGRPITFTATVGEVAGPYSYTLTNGRGSTLTGKATNPSGNPFVFTQSLTAWGSGPQTYTLTVGTGADRVSRSVDLSVSPGPAVADGPVCTSFIKRTTANAGFGSNAIRGVFQLGQRVYVATDGGLSISTDGGRGFSNRTTGLGLGPLGVYAVGNTIYVATRTGLSISTDGGETFTNRTTNHGLGNDRVNGVYAVGSTVYAATENGLSISIDGGTYFVNKTTADGLGSNDTHGVYVVDNVVYVATIGGLGVSTDRGDTFTNRTSVSSIFGSNQLFGVYAVGTTVYAASGGGLKISYDGGTTFTQRSTEQGLGDNQLLGVYAQGKTVYAATLNGLSISTDGGQHFTNYTPANTGGGIGANQVNAVFVAGDRLYVAASGPTGGGGGLSYCPGFLGLTSLSASPNPVTAGQPTTFTATVGGVTGSYSYTLTNGVDTPLSGTASGAVFSQRLAPQATGAQTYTLTIDADEEIATATTSLTVLAQPITLTGLAASPNPVKAGQPVTFTATVDNVTDGYSYTLGNGVATPLSGTASGTAFSQSLTATASGTQTFTLTVATEGEIATATTSLTVLAQPITLTDLAANPNPVVAGQPITFTATVANFGRGYFYTLTNGRGSIRTGTADASPFSQTLTAQDSGAQTYTLTVNPFDEPTPGSATVDITVSPGPPIADGPACTNFINRPLPNASPVTRVYAVGSTVYATTETGLAISTDGGNSFPSIRTTVSGLGANQVNAVYAVGSTVYAATDGGLSISTNGGQTFTNYTLGLSNNQARAVYVQGNTIYVATRGGLGVSTDGDQTFAIRTGANGLGDNLVNGVYAVDNTVYAATNNGLSISNNGGSSFAINRTTASPGGIASNVVLGVYAQGGTVYVATDNGLSISPDGGQTFANRTTGDGLGSNNVNAVYAVGRTVYAATNNGLSISIDGGQRFTNYTPGNTGNGLGSTVVYGVHVAGDRIYAATQGGISFCPRPVVPPTISALSANPNPVQAGQVVTFTATVGGVSGSYSYTLSQGTDASLSGTTTNASFSQGLTAQGSGIQTYTLTIADDEGIATAMTSLTVLAPNITLTGLAASPNPVTTGQSVLFTATVGGVTGSYAYTLANGVDTPLSGTANSSSFTQALTASGSGLQTFTLTVAAENGTATATTTLSVLAPSSGLTITDLKTSRSQLPAGESLEFTATLTGLVNGDIYSYTLTNGLETTPLKGDYSGRDFIESVTAQGAGPQTYTLTVTSLKGIATATVSVTVTVRVGLEQFGILGVTDVSCETLSDNQRRLTFTPQYVGTNGTPISFSVVNELASTTSGGPYNLRLYTDNPTITLVASQGGRGEVRFIYHWLATCQGSPIPPQAPVSTSIPNQTLQQGQAYQLALTDYVTDPDGQTPQFTVQGLPAGLSLSEGLLSGKPSTTGTYPVNLTATDPGGLSIAVGFTLTVVPASGAVPTFSIGGVSPVSCVLVDSVKQGYQVRFTPQYSGITGQPISFSVINELAATTSAGPYTLRLYADNPVIILQATQTGSPGVASFNYNWLAACPPAAVSLGPFKLVGVTAVSCEVIGGGERRVHFTPQYTGLDGTPVSLSVVNELAPTSSPGPYTLRLYTDNSTITLSAQQGLHVTTYRYDWLAVCQAPARLGNSEPGPGLSVKVLGNPIQNNQLSVEVTGAEGQALQLQLLTPQGRVVFQQQLPRAEAIQRHQVSVAGQAGGLLLLQVSTLTQSQTVKVLKAN